MIFSSGSKVIPNQHFLLTANEGCSYFHGRKPVDVDVRDNVFGIIKGEIGNVFHVTAEMSGAGGNNSLRFLADDIIHDGDIMRSQIPDDINVMLEQTEVDAHGIKIIEIAQRVFVNQLPDFPSLHRCKGMCDPP